MSTTVTFLGAAGFVIEGPTHRVLIDPFLRGNPAAPLQPSELAAPDVILVTHAAPDHLGDAAEIALATGAPVVCDAAVARILLDAGVPQAQVRATVWGVVIEVAGLLVRPVECHHWSAGVLSSGEHVTGNPLAFIVETEPGISIYHYGDTSIFDMRLLGELYRPTVGLLGCTVPHELAHLVPGAGRIVSGEMDAVECARVAGMLGLTLAVACHYLEPDEEVRRFLELVHGDGPRRRGPARRAAPGARPRPPRGGHVRLVTVEHEGRLQVAVRRGAELLGDRLRGDDRVRRRRPRGARRGRRGDPHAAGRRASLGADRAGEAPVLRDQLPEPPRGEPGRRPAGGAVLLRQAPERRHRPRRDGRPAARRPAGRLRGRARLRDRPPRPPRRARPTPRATSSAGRSSTT